MHLPFSVPGVLRTRNAAIGAVILGVLLIAGLIVLLLGPRNHLDFALRQKVSAQSILNFSFPESMDKKSVEESISSVQEVEGTWSWDGDTLRFDPAENLKAGQTYTFFVPSSTLTAAGSPLGRDLEFVFIVAGPPKLAAQIPTQNATGIASTSRITLVFDRPMIPLSQVQGEFAKDAINEWPVTITPAVDGRWRWLSTVAREFIPAKGLTAGTKYTVSVPAGITSVAGDSTEEDFSWSFETLRPTVESVQPEPGSTQAGPSTEVVFHFNRDIDLDSAKKGITLYKDLKGTVASGLLKAPPEAESIPVGSVKYGLKEENEKNVTDRTSIVVTPKTPFAFSTKYAAYVAAGVRGTEGELGTLSGYVVRFTTVGDLMVKRGGFKSDENRIAIEFSNPMSDLATILKKGITIDPAPENAKNIEWGVVMWSDTNEVTTTAGLELKPSTSYTVTVKNLKDVYGQTLKEPYTFKFTTPSVTPRAFIHSEGIFGIFERGKPPVYYLNAINVSKLDVEFAKLDVREFLAARSDMHNNGEFAPALAGKNLYKTWSLPPVAKKDEWGVSPFDVSKQVGQDLEPGIYALQLRAPEYKEYWNQKDQAVEQQFFVITNLAVTLKYSGDKALVWVTDMQTGEPVKSAIIAINRLDGKQTRTGTTDAQGFFEVDLPAGILGDCGKRR
jgi:alpha-2-macroglobulin